MSRPRWVVRRSILAGVLFLLPSIACKSTDHLTPTGVVDPDTLNFTPDPVIFLSPGGRVQISGVVKGNAVTSIKSSDFQFLTTDAAIAKASNPTGPAGGFEATVDAVGPGLAEITAQIPTGGPKDTFRVIVWPGGTWRGVVTLVSTSCNPSGAAAYDETAKIEVNAQGVGTLTAIDTPGFNRAYNVAMEMGLLPSSDPQFKASGTGTFPYNGVAVGGVMAVSVSRPAKLTYLETTTYANCSATYGGTLTLSPSI